MTPELYYIHQADHREGPFDTLALMRKIRAGKINAQTLISTPHSGEAHPLYAYPALEHLVATSAQNASATSDLLRAEALFMRGLATGARLINRHLLICVMTGVVIFALLIIATFIGNFTGFMTGYTAWLIMALTLYPTLQLLMLRLSRGHYAGVAALREYIVQRLPTMLLLGLVMAVSVLAGTVLLLLPGLLLFTLFSYAVPLAAEGKYSPVECLYRSARIVASGGLERFGALFGLASINLLSLFCIIPLAIIWPMAAAAVADIGEETMH